MIDMLIAFDTSHASWPNCIRNYPGELLLCLCWMLLRISGDRLFLLPVSSDTPEGAGVEEEEFECVLTSITKL